MMVRATDLLFMRILRGHLTKATTGVGSIAASRFTDHGLTEMEDLPLRFAEALKPVYECRYFSTRVWAVAGFVHDQSTLISLAQISVWLSGCRRTRKVIRVGR